MSPLVSMFYQFLMYFQFYFLIIVSKSYFSGFLLSCFPFFLVFRFSGFLSERSCFCLRDPVSAWETWFLPERPGFCLLVPERPGNSYFLFSESSFWFSEKQEINQKWNQKVNQKAKTDHYKRTGVSDVSNWDNIYIYIYTYIWRGKVARRGEATRRRGCAAARAGEARRCSFLQVPAYSLHLVFCRVSPLVYQPLCNVIVYWFGLLLV